jgi:uncharacterized protein (TIGR02246 family)
MIGGEMKRWAIRVLVLVCFCVIFVPASARQSNRPGDERAIEDVIARMTNAFNQHAADTTVMTPDADFVNVQGVWLHGAEQIQRGRAALFEKALSNARLRIVDTKIRFLRADVAIAHVTDEITGMTGADGGTLPLQRELSLRVFTRDRGRWLTTAFHNTPIATPSPSR